MKRQAIRYRCDQPAYLLTAFRAQKGTYVLPLPSRLQPRYQKALEEAQADVAYYQVLAQEKRQEAGRRNRLGIQAMSREEIDQANNVLQTVLHFRPDMINRLHPAPRAVSA